MSMECNGLVLVVYPILAVYDLLHDLTSRMLHVCFNYVSKVLYFRFEVIHVNRQIITPKFATP
jgi:hypothetical protein